MGSLAFQGLQPLDCSFISQLTSPMHGAVGVLRSLVVSDGWTYGGLTGTQAQTCPDGCGFENDHRVLSY